ncbi:hypothetical protein D9619_004288 [Psilocybe cf. subviscida]|uniref:Uncharacterized protein n=1 Tax=Psilocybe cf. subviscida TaxID=2480587 RepID=A0A8H5BP25_9AGAR|nr:hypothetical protein D9619_004288 [Psilocybe cf. subviscida]
MTLHWLAFGSLALVGVAAAGKDHKSECMAGYTWMNNDHGESPCQVASELASLCSPGGGTPGILPGNTRDNLNSTQTPCTCNTVTYSLSSACTVCRGQSTMTWSSWAQDCNTTVDGLGRFPVKVPENLIVPLWAYNPEMDKTTKAFDVSAARGNATITSYRDALANFDLQTSVIVASGIAYGIVVVLSFNCAYDMVMSKHQNSRKRTTLVVYIIFMAVLSTIAFTEVGTYFWTAFSHNGAGDATSVLWFKNYSAPTPLPFLILGADGFMIYRCQALYVNISRKYRAILLVVLCSLFLGLCATAVLFFFLPGNSWFGIILPSSTAVNVILSLLITLRTARLQREHRRVLGILKEDPDSTPYSRISELCLESSSLMILFGLTLTIMLARTKSGSEALRAGGWILVPLMVFPHICVISPLLISYRVAHGSDVSTTTISHSPIQFRSRSARASSIAYMTLSRYTSTFDPLRTDFTSESESQSSIHLPLYYNQNNTAEALTDVQPSRQSTLDVIPESPQPHLAQTAPPTVSILQSRAPSVRRVDSEDSVMQTSFHFPFAYHDVPAHMQPSRQSSLNTSVMMPDSPKSMFSVLTKKGGGYRKLPEPPIAVIADSELMVSPSRSTTLLSLSHFPFVTEAATNADVRPDARVNSLSPEAPALPLPVTSNQNNSGPHIRKLPSIPQTGLNNV